jgi:Ca-activated chloride channel homolog
MRLKDTSHDTTFGNSIKTTISRGQPAPCAALSVDSTFPQPLVKPISSWWRAKFFATLLLLVMLILAVPGQEPTPNNSPPPSPSPTTKPNTNPNSDADAETKPDSKPQAKTDANTTAAPTAPFQDDGIFKIRADLKTVLVSVTDSSGRLVNSLDKADFEIYENDLAQEIITFGRENTLPLQLVLLFDVSASVKPRLKFEQQAATKFFRAVVRPVDQAALFSFNHDVTVEKPFTNDIEALANATRSLKAKGGTALFDAIYLAAERLERVNGRRVIVVLSDGSNTISRTTMETALRRVESADAVIYGIYTAQRLTETELGRIPGDKELEKICDRTGGEVFFPKNINDLDEQFIQLGAILRAQYALSYYSTNEKRDGTYRLTRISVKNPELKVRARKGYYAPKD